MSRRQSPRSALLVLPLVASLVTACFHAGPGPRSGELLAAGDIAGGVQLTVAGYAPGRFGSERGNTAQRAPLSPLVLLGMFFQNAQGFVRVGLHDRVEAEALIGYQELALGTRVGVLQEWKGDSLSIAANGAAYFRPNYPAYPGDDELFSKDGFGVRGGLDISRWVSDNTALVWNPTLSYGPEGHALTAPRDQPCGGFSGTGCGEYGPSTYAFSQRRELRVHSPIGTSFHYEGYRFTVGLAPYYTLRSEVLKTTCEGCADSAKGELEEDWGANLVFRFDASEPRRTSP